MRNDKREWKFLDLVDIPALFQSEIGGASIVSQALYRRGLSSLQDAIGFLDPNHYQPTHASELPGLMKAANRIQSTITSANPILIWGDFDVDGQTSTTLLTSALSDLGCNVKHYIPNRATESHGVTVESLAKIIEHIRPELLITCDTGIDAFDPVKYANSKDLDVIITDHHQLPPTLPDAFSIINPSMLDPEHPLSTLPGVGVAYKLIEEIYSRFDLDPKHFLDLVALGIVADVARLRGDTRYLLQLGLPVLQNTTRAGLLLLYENARIESKSIGEDQIGFGIGPRLNALGRLSDANSCVDFFTSSDPILIEQLASQLEILNSQRQELTERIFNEAVEMIRNYPELDEEYPVLVLQGPPDWNPGVIGIVASRLVERYNKPAIVLSQDGVAARGSARSVKGIGISELISLTSSILTSHGGHPMAAGVSLPLANVTQFRRDLSTNYNKIYGDVIQAPEINIDGEIPFEYITSDFIADFKRLAPFGAGNSKLIFATRNVKKLSDSLIGRKKNHRKLSLSDSSGIKQEFLWWNSADIAIPKESFDIAFSLDNSTYRGKLQTQATIKHFRNSVETPIYISKKEGYDLVDYRKIETPLSTLSTIVNKESDAVIWAEYNQPDGYQSQPRLSLKQAKTLVIWTTPPSIDILKKYIEIVSPNKIILFDQNPGINTQVKFLEALIGMLKHLASSQKAYQTDLFAQRISQTPSIIETGLDWLHYHGDFDLSIFRTKYIMKEGDKISLPGFDNINQKFKIMHHEIRLSGHIFKAQTYIQYFNHEF